MKCSDGELEVKTKINVNSEMAQCVRDWSLKLFVDKAV
jgi:hypothetical protein